MWSGQDIITKHHSKQERLGVRPQGHLQGPQCGMRSPGTDAVGSALSTGLAKAAGGRSKEDEVSEVI